MGRLVLWSAQPEFVDAQGTVLGATKVRHIAIANPKVAPYGAAALQVIKARRLTAALAPKLVPGESIAQAHQFLATGNAEIGFVALSQVAVPGKPVAGSHWLVPAELHDPVRQDAVLLKAGEKNPAVMALLDYLKRESTRAMIREHDYGA